MDNESENPERFFAEQLEEIKRDWNETMKTLVQQWHERKDQSLPEIPDDELIERGPHLLEQLTEPQGDERKNEFMVLTAPSGVGKGTVGRTLEERGVEKLPRVNTRPIRPGEVNGVDYFFVDDAEFERMKSAEEVFAATSTAEESKDAGGASKVVASHDAAKTQAGIPVKRFDEMVASGKKFYLDSGAGTARYIKSELHVENRAFKVVFLLAPSFDEMIRRLGGRRGEEASTGSTMSDATTIDRLRIAVNHLRKSVDTVDGYVVNDDVERAVDQLQKYLED